MTPDEQRLADIEAEKQQTIDLLLDGVLYPHEAAERLRRLEEEIQLFVERRMAQ